MRKFFLTTVLTSALTFFFLTVFAQPTINVLDSGHKVSIRGLSVVDDNIIWASGSNGSVAKSTNGGKSFEWLKVKGYETRDFRDVEAFSADTALIMAVDVPALILKTYDGGNTWKEVFKDTTPGMFLDAMDFKNPKDGVVIGDPLTNQPFFAYTNNNGETWHTLNQHEKNVLPMLDSGEAFFASSGTNIISLKFNSPYFGEALIVSGGRRSQLYTIGSSEKNIPLPITQGKSSTGANSVAVEGINANSYTGVIVGGDYAHDRIVDSNCVLFQVKKGVFKLSTPQTPPHGYRSCVIYLAKDKLITCGTSGVDISEDGGLNWMLISHQSFHVCQKAKHGNAVFLAGANGKIAVYR